MTPSEKITINQLLEPYDAEITTEIGEGQDIRFIKIRTYGYSENPLNVLDNEGYMVHSEEPLAQQVARSAGGSLLRLCSIWQFRGDHGSNNQLMLEDVKTKWRRNEIAPQGSGGAFANVREPRRPRPQMEQGWGNVYPPNHPSRTGQKIT